MSNLAKFNLWIENSKMSKQHLDTLMICYKMQVQCRSSKPTKGNQPSKYSNVNHLKPIQKQSLDQYNVIENRKAPSSRQTKKKKFTWHLIQHKRNKD